MNSQDLALKIGKSIKIKRLINELTRAELAEFSGVKALTIQRIENGQGSALGLDNLLPILNVLKINLAAFLEEIQNEPIAPQPKNLAPSPEKDFLDSLAVSIQNMPDEQKTWLKNFISHMVQSNLEKA